MRRLLPCFTALTLLLAACGDDDATTTSTTADVTTSTEDPTTSSTTSTTSTSEPDDDAGPQLGQSCSSPDGFTISYPEDWDAVSDCGQFGPAPLDEPAPATDERPGVVSAYVDPVPYGDVTQPVATDRERAVTAVDGRSAVRIVAETPDEGLYPGGTATVRWVVDLTLTGEDQPATLFLDAIDLRDDVDFDEAVATLDAMARTLEIEAGPAPASDDVIARYQGGGIPFTVAAAPSASTPASCLRLLETEGSIACVEAVEEPDGVSLTALDAPSGPITVGIAGADVFAVEVEATGDTTTFLPVPYPGRDSAAFALPLDPEDVTTVTLRSAAGETLAEVPIDEARRPADS